MRDVFYVELGKKNEEIRQIKQDMTPEAVQEKNQYLIDVMDEIIHLDNVGRKEGLLAIESAVYDMDDSKRFLKMMVELIVDGTDPALVEEIGFMKYMTNGYKAYEGLTCLMQIVGSLSLQKGENPRIMEEKLLAMMPNEVEDIFRARREAEIKSWYEQKPEEIDMSKVERLYEGNLNTEIVETGYPELEKLDYLLKQIEDRSLQRALREIYNSDLELAMKGLSGEGRHRIFMNMSKRLCVMVAEDMEEMGRCRKVDIGEAAKKVFDIFMSLMECCEIRADESDEVYGLYYEYMKSKTESTGEQE